MIDYGSVKYRREEFDKRHGGNAVQVDEWLVYSDGAMREVNPLGALLEPDADPFKCAQVVVRYYENRVQRAVEEFDAYKAHLTSFTTACRRNGHPPPGATELERLKELQQTVQARQKELDAARDRLRDATPAHRKAREQVAAECKSASERMLSAIAGIKV
jgi:hypothetical protein